MPAHAQAACKGGLGGRQTATVELPAQANVRKGRAPRLLFQAAPRQEQRRDIKVLGPRAGRRSARRRAATTAVIPRLRSSTLVRSRRWMRRTGASISSSGARSRITRCWTRAVSTRTSKRPTRTRATTQAGIARPTARTLQGVEHREEDCKQHQRQEQAHEVLDDGGNYGNKNTFDKDESYDKGHRRPTRTCIRDGRGGRLSASAGNRGSDRGSSREPHDSWKIMVERLTDPRSHGLFEHVRSDGQDDR